MNKTSCITSMDEYEKLYFPKKEEQSIFALKDPREIGIGLARESLKKLKKKMRTSQKPKP